MSESNVITLPERARRTQLECAPWLYPPVLLPAGNYELEYALHRLERHFKRSTLTVYFVVIDEHWPQNVSVVARYYPVSTATNKIKRGEARTTWRPPKHGALVSEFRKLFPYRRLPRLDRFPIALLAEHRVIGRLGTVEKDHEHVMRDEHSQYSVVRELIRCSS